MAKELAADSVQFKTKQRGMSMSVFWLFGFIAVLIAAGLVIDGAAYAAAKREASVVAAYAARSGSDASAADRISGSGFGNAETAAYETLSSNPSMTGTVTVDSQGTIHVETTIQVPTTFLSLIGINSLTARGSATAQLQIR